MKKITAILLSLAVAVSLAAFSTNASAGGYYYKTKYISTPCGCKKVVYKVRCCHYVPTCCRHETPCNHCGCGFF